MRVVGIENIICDYYFDQKNSYINGGGTVANILVNLDQKKIPCKLIGYCGSDKQGIWIINSLKKTKIDTKDIQMTSNRTKSFYIMENKTSSICPFCKSKKKRYPNLSISKIHSLLKPDDYILLKDYSKTNEQIMSQCQNKIFLDLSMIKPLLYCSKEEIENYIFNHYKVINIKENVFLFFQKKLKQSAKELLEKMNSEIILITKGKKGVEFFHNHRHYIFDIKEPFLEIETNGCGDAFFSNIIFETITNPRKIRTKKDFDKMFEESQKQVKIVIQTMGARNHIIPNQQIKKQNNECICDTFHLISY